MTKINVTNYHHVVYICVIDWIATSSLGADVVALRQAREHGATKGRDGSRILDSMSRTAEWRAAARRRHSQVGEVREGRGHGRVRRDSDGCERRGGERCWIWGGNGVGGDSWFEEGMRLRVRISGWLALLSIWVSIWIVGLETSLSRKRPRLNFLIRLTKLLFILVFI